MTPGPGFNPDFEDLLAALHAQNVQFLVVGAHALAAHGVPRATGDLDVWVRPEEANAGRVVAALNAFGAPLPAHGITARDFSTPGLVYQLGLPPRRIDLLTQLSGLEFDEAWPGRVVLEVAGEPVPFLGREALLKNKRATGRPKDLADAALLEAAAR